MSRADASSFRFGLAAVFVCKLILLAFDHTPNFYLGDSAAFLATAVTMWVPPQRSWTYGMFMHWFCLPVHSLQPLLIAQMLAGVVTCAIVGLFLFRFLRTTPWVAVTAMVLCALDPLQLLMERMVMAEAFSLCALMLLLAACFRYREMPTMPRLLLLQGLLIVAVSLRIQILSAGGLAVLAIPFLAVRERGRLPPHSAGARLSKPAWLALHLGLVLGVSGVLHFGYCLAMGWKHHQPPAYSYGTNLIVLGALAPVIHPEDGDGPAVAAVIRDDAVYPMADRYLRNEQIWEPYGLAHRLREFSGDRYAADRMGRGIVRRAFMRDPLGVLKCGCQNYLDFWDFSRMPGWLLIDRQPIPPFPEAFAETLHDHFAFAVGTLEKPTLSKVLQSWSMPWLLVLLTGPLFMTWAALLAQAESGPAIWLFPIIGVALLLQNTMLASLPCYRLLHPLTALTWIAVGVIAGHWPRRAPLTSPLPPAYRGSS